ncbi:C2 domain-containing protein [Quillaja saponaria]|uniref:C2 domain-containing protein n=1 Tax=Quillaja saponaria TaxID=32244 RepID=A0AAD7KSQ2_QUISA|nr:C2 domain-containing protein [Quillaja saponaria]
MAKQSKENDLSVKEISPKISAINNNNITSGLDLVEISQFLYVRIKKAINLPGICGPNTCIPYVEVKLGEFKGTTPYVINCSNPEWNRVFAFSKELIQTLALSSFVILVKDKAVRNEPTIGRRQFSIADVPNRLTSESAIATHSYELKDGDGPKNMYTGELLMSVWIGTQADDAFHDAFHFDADQVSDDNIGNTRAKVYLQPRIWILRVYVYEGQDFSITEATDNSGIFIQANFGSVTLRSKLVKTKKNVNPKWNENLFFAAAEQIDGHMVLTVVHETPSNHQCLGTYDFPLKGVSKKLDGAPPAGNWCNLKRPIVMKDQQDQGKGKVQQEQVEFKSKLKLGISLDGGYHIFDEDPEFSSDFRATAKKLSKSHIGFFELGILSATGLAAMKKGKKENNRTDAYCVVKYGPKWIRTRTIVDSLSPKWNEQYSWEVYDICTFITILVLDNAHIQGGRIAEGVRDAKMGKVTIGLSTLEVGRIYTYSYPLLQHQPSLGLKKMGEIQLAFRLKLLISKFDLLHTYAYFLHPRLHYTSPLSRAHTDNLSKQAVMLISKWFKQAEPPLREEVVNHMLAVRAKLWSMRKGRTTFDRISVFLNALVATCKWFEEVMYWKDFQRTLMVHAALVGVIFCPKSVLQTIFAYLILNVLSQYSKRPRHPAQVDLKLSHVHTATVNELQEEFDPVPSKYGGVVLRNRYDCMRKFGERMVSEMGYLAMKGEMVESLVSWKDPVITFFFLFICLFVGIVTFVVPLQWTMILGFAYLLKHPRFRAGAPFGIPRNLLSRMPTNADCML